jgi:hypothetical protein
MFEKSASLRKITFMAQIILRVNIMIDFDANSISHCTLGCRFDITAFFGLSRGLVSLSSLQTLEIQGS